MKRVRECEWGQINRQARRQEDKRQKNDRQGEDKKQKNKGTKNRERIDERTRDKERVGKG